MAANRMPLSEIMLAIFVFTMILFSYRSGLTQISQLAGYALIAAFLYESIFRSQRFVFVMPVPLLFLYGFVAYLALSLMWSHQVQGFELMITLIKLLFISFAMINIIHDTGTIRSIKIGFISALLVATYDVWQTTGGVVSDDDTQRIGSFLANANVFAIALFIGIVLVLDSLLSPFRRQDRQLFGFAWKTGLIVLLVMFSYEIMFLTGSRKGMISLFIILFMFFLKSLHAASFLNKTVIFITGTGLFVGLFQVLRESVYFERLSRLFSLFSGGSVREGSLNERANMMADGLRLWQEKPILGWGADQFRYIAGYQTYSHNNYVEILSNNGIVGFLLYYAMIASLFVIGVRLMLRRDRRTNFYGWLSVTTLLIILFWDFALVSYYNKLHWLLLSVLIGMTYFVMNKRPEGAGEAPAAVG